MAEEYRVPIPKLKNLALQGIDRRAFHNPGKLPSEPEEAVTSGLVTLRDAQTLSYTGHAGVLAAGGTNAEDLEIPEPGGQGEEQIIWILKQSSARTVMGSVTLAPVGSVRQGRRRTTHQG